MIPLLRCRFLIIGNANHMVYSDEAIKATTYIANIFPQDSEFNRQNEVWHYTELLSECLRDLTDLKKSY